MFRLIVVFSIFFCSFVNSAPKGLSQLAIIGGENAKIENFRYMLNLLVQGAHWCGAVLVSQNTALTAAHCTNGKPLAHLSVVAGSLNVAGSGGIHVSVSRVVEHPDFSLSPLDNDISILFLKEDFELGPTIGTINLITRRDYVPDGALATVSGWGEYKVNSTASSQNLQFANIPIWSEISCRPFLEREQRSPELNYCAGYVNVQTSTCRGDSGGPLIYNNKLIGLVSAAVPCGTIGFPAIYTKVVKYRDWIAKETLIFAINPFLNAINKNLAIINT